MPAELPWMKWFPNDWLSDCAVRACSAAARGVWVDILCSMHLNGRRRGYLDTPDGQPMPAAALARLTGTTPDEFASAIAELERHGVFSKDASGVIFSRRILREEEFRANCSEAGKKGGNPQLRSRRTEPGYVYAARRARDGATKIGASINPRSRIAHPTGTMRGESLSLIHSWPVSNMGAAESGLHDYFKDSCLGGEWFRLTDSDLLAAGGWIVSNGLNEDAERVRQKVGQRVRQKVRKGNAKSLRGSEVQSTEINTVPPSGGARPRNELFDAIAEATGADPATTGGHLGKVTAALKDGGYTVADVKDFAKRFLILCPWAKDDGRTRPELGELQNHIGKVRTNPPKPTTLPGYNPALDW